MRGNQAGKDKVDVAIIGAGVVGLAVAAEVAARRPPLSIVLVEKHEAFGRETSSRNSEVIHSGLYYPPGSLKARLCVEGAALLYRFCDKHGVNYRRCGKLVVALSENDEDTLAALQKRGAANLVAGLEHLGAAAFKKHEPNIRAKSALYVPAAGLIDSHQLMACLEQKAIRSGVLPAYCHELRALEAANRGSGFLLHLVNPDGSFDTLTAERVVNCAGLKADQVAASAGINPLQAGYKQRLCKGEYFSLPSKKAALVNGLVYPPPLKELTGLGIHATKTLDGRLKLGPNTLYLSEAEGEVEGEEGEDYSVNAQHAGQFFAAVSAFMPFVKLADLEPEMAGIRPKLYGPGEPWRDFVIKDEAACGLPGLVNLMGIESPGLTAALSIGRLVADLLLT